MLTGKDLDFGFSLVKKTETDRWFRGYGGDSYVYHVRKGPRKFLGGAWQVESESELQRSASQVRYTYLTTDTNA